MSSVTGNPSAASIARVFNALSGEELKKAILLDIEKKLNNHPELKAHLTFPVVAYQYTIAIRAYPREKQMEKVTGGAQYRAADPQTGQWVPTEQTSVDMLIHGQSETIDRPDDARERRGLPIPERQDTKPVTEALVQREVVTVDPRVEDARAGGNIGVDAAAAVDAAAHDAATLDEVAVVIDLANMIGPIEPGPRSSLADTIDPGAEAAVPASTDKPYARSAVIDKRASGAIAAGTEGRGQDLPGIASESPREVVAVTVAQQD